VSDLSILNTSLSVMISYADDRAAESLHERMLALNAVDRIYQISFVERGWIIREFKIRELWKHLVDPETGCHFPNLTAWLSCSAFLGCRRTNFEALRDIEDLQDIPAAKLIDVPKSNVKILKQLSTAVRNSPEVLEQAKTLPQAQFLEKMEQNHPGQYLEGPRLLRFSPPKSGARVVEAWIAYALEHDLAGTRDEAIVMACEAALHDAKLDEELASMPVEEVTA
jgi:hypothetical protein